MNNTFYMMCAGGCGNEDKEILRYILNLSTALLIVGGAILLALILANVYEIHREKQNNKLIEKLKKKHIKKIIIYVTIILVLLAFYIIPHTIIGRVEWDETMHCWCA